MIGFIIGSVFFFLINLMTKALWTAFENENYKVAKLLIDAGVDVNKTDEVFTPNLFKLSCFIVIFSMGDGPCWQRVRTVK